MKVQLKDIEVGYRRSGKGVPAVFVHGLAEDRRHWRVTGERLRGIETFAYDMRGHGETSLGRPEGTLAQLGGDLIAFLETVTAPAPCVGFSLGGCIILWVAAMRPDLVPHAVVAGTSSVVGKAAAEFFHDRIALIERDLAGFSAALREDTMAQMVSGNADLEQVLARRVEAVGEGGGYINAARAMLHMHEEPLTPLLERISCRVDVVGGDGDLFCPRKAADIILAALRRGVYHEIENAGHLIGEDQPAAYAAAIQTALQQGAT